MATKPSTKRRKESPDGDVEPLSSRERGRGEGAVIPAKAGIQRAGKPSSLLDTRIIYCGHCLEQLSKLPPGSIDLIYIDPPFNSNRNYEVFWGETKEKRAFEGRHAGVHRLHAAALRRTRPAIPLTSNFPDE